MSLHKRLLTQLDGKMTALRVAYMDVGKGREHGCGSFAYMDVGKGREHGCGSFAYMDVGKRREKGYGSFAPEKAPLGVARCSFGTTKLRASRLAYRDVGEGHEQGCGSFDWHFFRGNSNNLIGVNRP